MQSRKREGLIDRWTDRSLARSLAVVHYWHYRTLRPWNLLGARVRATRGTVAARLATYEYAASRARVTYTTHVCVFLLNTADIAGYKELSDVNGRIFVKETGVLFTRDCRRLSIYFSRRLLATLTEILFSFATFITWGNCSQEGYEGWRDIDDKWREATGGRWRRVASCYG